MDKELRKVVKALEEQGFEVVPTKSGHYLVLKDGRRVTTMSGTPSDRRSFANALAPLRRAGFRWKR